MMTDSVHQVILTQPTAVERSYRLWRVPPQGMGMGEAVGITHNKNQGVALI